jgi:hypothetical protein
MHRVPNVLKGLVAVCALALLASSARAADEAVPRFKKKGDQEKKFYSEVCMAIIKAARTSAKNPTLDRYELKEVDGKPNRYRLEMKGKFQGVATRKEYVANIVVHIDGTNKDAWEVLRIDYDDNSNNIVSWNRKNLENLVKKFNE